MQKSTFTKILITASVLIFISCYYIFDLGQFLNFDFLKSKQAELIHFYNCHPFLTAAVYFHIYILVTALSIPGAAIMTLAGGAIFGLAGGVILVSFASSLGATIAFLVSRYLLRDNLLAKWGHRLDSINKGITDEGGFYLFTLRLIPVIPFFLVNILFGLSSMAIWSFYWISQFGMLAGTIVYVNAGTQLAQLESPAGILSIQIIGSFVLIGIFPILSKKTIEFVKLRRGSTFE